MRPAFGRQPRSGFWRVACCEPCQLESADGEVRTGLLWNVSTLGIYILLKPPLPTIDQRLCVSFPLPGDPTPIRSEADVVWINPVSLFVGCGAHAPHLPPGCGLRFAQLEPADLERIRALVRSLYPGSN